MSNYVITIARGFGSGGKQTAIQLSKMLSIPYYDKEILKMASDESGINEALFKKVDEKLRSAKLARKLRKYKLEEDDLNPENNKFVSDENLFSIQAKIIKHLAKTESCIIIGKCADYVLRSYPNVVSVYIEAPREQCLTSITERYGIDEKEAK